MEEWNLKTVSDTKKIRIKEGFLAGNNKGKEMASFKYQGLKFAWLYQNIKIKYKVIIIIFVALTMGVITLFFIQNTGLYTPGMGGITQGFSRLIGSIMYGKEIDNDTIQFTTRILFYILQAVVNIPGIIFSYKKIGKEFAFLTSIYIIVSNIFPFLLTIIPGINELEIFGNVTSDFFSSSGSRPLPPGISNFLIWNTDNEKVISLLFYAVGYAMLASVPLTFCYVVGASSGGFDILALYLLKVKRKKLGSIFLVNNLISLLIASLMGTFLTIGIIAENTTSIGNQFIVENFFSPNMLVTMVLIFMFSAIINKIYPRFKIIGIKIISSKSDKLDEKMFHKNNNHARLISYGVGGYKKEEQEIITIYCFIYEAHNIINQAKKINKNVFITIDEGVSVEGVLSYEKFLS